MNRSMVFGLLLVVLVAALFLLSVAVGTQSGSVDADDTDRLAGMESGLRNLPGFGSSLQADQVDTDCFDRQTLEFEGEAPVGCRFDVPEGIDQIRFRLVTGPCVIEVSDQPGVFDNRINSADWEDGRHDVSLTGDGAAIRLSPIGVSTGQSCVLALRS